VRSAAQAESPQNAYVCVVSDHGFASVQHDVNLYKLFLENGLITLNAQHAIASWKATLWPMGGSAAVILADPNDKATKQTVDALLSKLAADPANGIDRILTHDDVVKGGGFAGAEPGYELGYQFSGPLVTPGIDGGMHGYPPDRPEMRSTFLLEGPGIASNHSIGIIDMRQIAPTLAKLLHAPLPSAELSPLSMGTADSHP
jgi:predicted AlkP superfamily pyrophosphatase or phosphodiesterase